MHWYFSKIYFGKNQAKSLASISFVHILFLKSEKNEYFLSHLFLSHHTKNHKSIFSKFLPPLFRSKSYIFHHSIPHFLCEITTRHNYVVKIKKKSKGLVVFCTHFLSLDLFNLLLKSHPFHA